MPTTAPVGLKFDVDLYDGHDPQRASQTVRVAAPTATAARNAALRSETAARFGQARVDEVRPVTQRFRATVRSYTDGVDDDGMLREVEHVEDVLVVAAGFDALLEAAVDAGAHGEDPEVYAIDVLGDV